MYCIKCGENNTKVIDSRVLEDWKSIRRRRECEKCHNRFTTFEKMEIISLIVAKSRDRKERYNSAKLEDSLLKAANKRNISTLILKNIIRNLESKWSNKKEISSKEIWKNVLTALLALDEVAYIRYASVHLKFETSKDFLEFIKKKA